MLEQLHDGDEERYAYSNDFKVRNNEDVSRRSNNEVGETPFARGGTNKLSSYKGVATAQSKMMSKRQKRVGSNVRKKITRTRRGGHSHHHVASSKSSVRQQKHGKRLIHSISVAQFDELKGNTLSYVFPKAPEPAIVSHSSEAIAELCLPDGGHKHSCDSIYILLEGKGEVPLYGFAYFRNRKDENEKRGAKQLALLIIARTPYFDRFRPFLTVAIEEYLDQGEEKKVIHTLFYALEESYWKTKQLAKYQQERRSAQSAIENTQEDDEDMLDEFDEFPSNELNDHRQREDEDNHDRFEEEREEDSDEISTDCDDASNEDDDDDDDAMIVSMRHLAQSTKNALLLSNSKTYTMHLWGRMFVMQPLNSLKSNEFGGIMLKELVLRFRVQTMSIWSALVSLKRILICGPDGPAEVVGNLVLATPLLLGPLGILILPNLVPYVTLADVDPVTLHTSYICGTTNGLFATKENWYDIVADPKTGKISQSTKSAMDRSLLKVTGNDLAFINRILDGIENGRRDEQWVRYEFANFTQDFLDAVRETELDKINKRGRYESSKSTSPKSFKDDSSPKSNDGSLVSPRGSQHHHATPTNQMFHKRKQSIQKWPTTFLKRKPPKSYSEKLVATFSGSSLWLRYRWMQLNPASINPRKRLSRIHSIAIQDVPEDNENPPVPPKRPDGWKSSSICVVTKPKTASTVHTIHEAMDKDYEFGGEETKWRKAVTPDGCPYYWNIETRETRWTLQNSDHAHDNEHEQEESQTPLVEDPNGEALGTTTKWVIGNGRWQKVNVVLGRDRVTKSIRLSDWVEETTETGEKYYWHLYTKETKWFLEDHDNITFNLHNLNLNNNQHPPVATAS